jgi:hypothetical protein
MRHNGIKLPTASLAHDHYHGVGLCPVLSVRYGRSADTLRSMQHLYCARPTGMCMCHCGWPAVCISTYLADNSFDCSNNNVVGL